MKRREFIIAGAAAASWSAAARAQQAMPVIGFLNSGSENFEASRLKAFREGLSETSYLEGRNVAIEYRWAHYQFDRLPELAHDLARRQVNVIAAGYNLAACLAAKAATATIPIVVQTGVDPVNAGLVSSLNRPGGNLTGTINLSNLVVPKHLEILRELLPRTKIIGLLSNPTNPAAKSISIDAEAAARSMGLQLNVVPASNERELDDAFARLREIQAGALVISPDTFFTSRSQRIAELALRDMVPTISPFPSETRAGALMSYGGSAVDQARQAGMYVGRILKGEKPRDLPVLQVTKVEFVINLKTAKALGLTFPLPLLGRADEVIE